MLISIAMMFLVGMSMGWICKKIHLPSLFGMIVTGIVLGPYVVNGFSTGIFMNEAICVGRDRRFYFEYFIGSKKDRSYYYFNESGIVIRS